MFQCFYQLYVFFFAIISETVISEKIYQYDHPCLYQLSNETLVQERKLAEHNETLIQSYCENNLTDVYSFFWYNKRSAHKDIIMSYICSSIIEVFSLLSAFFYYNDMKRIKYCIKGKMNEESGLIKYGKLGTYQGKIVDKKEKKPPKVKEKSQKEKGSNVLNVNKNNYISESNSIILDSNKKKKKDDTEHEKVAMNDLEELSNISGKNPSTKENKQLDEMSNDLQVFY